MSAIVEGGPIGGPIGGSMDSLTARQLEVIQLLNQNYNMSKRALAKTLKINVSAAQRHLDALKEKGVIQREGGTRGYWKVLVEI